jgi:hypothetical protein
MPRRKKVKILFDRESDGGWIAEVAAHPGVIVYPVRIYGNWQVGLAVDVSVVAFDVAIVAHAVRMYRNRRSHSQPVLPQ